jgi:hypothetical protein
MRNGKDNQQPSINMMKVQRLAKYGVSNKRMIAETAGIYENT